MTAATSHTESELLRIYQEAMSRITSASTIKEARKIAMDATARAAATTQRAHKSDEQHLSENSNAT